MGCQSRSACVQDFTGDGAGDGTRPVISIAGSLWPRVRHVAKLATGSRQLGGVPCGVFHKLLCSQRVATTRPGRTWEVATTVVSPSLPSNSDYSVQSSSFR